MKRRRRHASHPAVYAAAVLVASLAARAAAGREIALTRDGGMYRVPVTLDGRLVLPFIVDTGADEVQVSTDVFRALFARDATPPTYLPGGAYRVADGRVVHDRRFVIPSLRIGDREFHRVTASIGGPGAPLLLGQNVLDRLGTWSIDSRRSMLVIGDGSGEPSRAQCANWQTAPGGCEVGAVRDFLRDLRPRYDVTKLRLLRSDGRHASVLVDVVRNGRTRTARLCGAMDLRHGDTEWRVIAASQLREVDPGVQCVE
jgi:predicted aspartyl protease